ncbi:MAG: cytochrome c3 family protein [Candidatus Methanoperedens sp.]|nr:cytochrome c3 family protein [Candidatus Methanoperedens sp.]MCZ7369793.1 cytochrome c3 family protein [Candidatus Methanoperedens sp.]
MKLNKIILSGILLMFSVFIVPGVLADNSCLNCHEKLSAFNETEQQFNQIRLQHLARDIPCSLECHTTTLSKFAKSNYEQWTKSKHALFNVTCNNCHGGDPSSEIKEKAHIGILISSDPNSTIFYRNVPETCGKCHVNELEQFRNSAHYQNLKALKQAPTCDTCHSPHEFMVLNISAFHNLCSQCHNIDMRIAPSDAPDKAIAALESADNLKNEIRKADDAIRQAKQQGKDVSMAQKDLDTAIAIMDGLPVLWHSFNLPHFQDVIDNGTKYAQQSQLDTGLPIAKPKAPGFGVIMSLTGIIAIYLLLRRK